MLIRPLISNRLTAPLGKGISWDRLPVYWRYGVMLKRATIEVRGHNPLTCAECTAQRTRVVARSGPIKSVPVYQKKVTLFAVERWDHLISSGSCATMALLNYLVSPTLAGFHLVSPRLSWLKRGTPRAWPLQSPRRMVQQLRSRRPQAILQVWRNGPCPRRWRLAHGWAAKWRLCKNCWKSRLRRSEYYWYTLLSGPRGKNSASEVLKHTAMEVGCVLRSAGAVG